MPIGTIFRMEQVEELLSEIDAYAALNGIQPETVCRLATGNPRLRDRLLRRSERLAADIERLRSYMSNKTPSESAPSSEAAQ